MWCTYLRSIFSLRINKLGILMSLHRSCYTTKRALLKCVCGRDVITSKTLAPSFRDLHLCWWHTNLFLSQSLFSSFFFSCYVLFGSVRESFQTQRVSNLVLRNALICRKLLHIERLLSLPPSEDKQGFFRHKRLPSTIKMNKPTCHVCDPDINCRMSHSEAFHWSCLAWSNPCILHSISSLCSYFCRVWQPDDNHQGGPEA